MQTLAPLPPLLPSHLQQLQLLSQVPNPLPPAPDAYKLLAPILSLLQTEWIRSFLFTCDPIHIPALTSPTLSSSCFLASQLATRIDPSSLDTHHLSNRFLYTPAFAIAPYSAGFGVAHFTYHVPDPLSGIWSSECTQSVPLRFVRDAERHVMVEVMHCLQLNSLFINYTKLETCYSTRVVQVLCNRAMLLNALDSSMNIPEEKVLQPSLEFIQDEIQRHNCKICGAKRGCMCTLPVEKAKHPFDTEFFRRSMKYLLGECEGVTNKLMYKDLLGIKQVVLGSRIVMEGVLDDEFCTSVAKAVAMRGRTEQVVRQPVLSIEDEKGEDDEEWWMDQCKQIVALEGDVEDISDSNASTGVDVEKHSEEDEEKERKRKEMELLEERRKRARQRRERNREAARKSNLRRKQARDGLVNDLEGQLQKVDKLRQKEIELRRENLRLRKLVANSSA